MGAIKEKGGYVISLFSSFNYHFNLVMNSITVLEIKRWHQLCFSITLIYQL